MQHTIKAIEAAYSKQVGEIYKAFAQALLIAAGDQADIAEAEVKFAKGLAFAANVRERALAQVE